jgi:hypothetical protein
MVAGPTPQLTQIDTQSAPYPGQGMYPLVSIPSRVGPAPEKLGIPEYTVAWLVAVQLQTSAVLLAEQNELLNHTWVFKIDGLGQKWRKNVTLYLTQ